MEKTITFQPSNVCSRWIYITAEDGVIKSVKFVGGCQGNTTGVCRLVEGMKVEEAIKRLEGIECRGSRTGKTSCPDQLAQALKQLD
ncbi:MAG: TIGR03905 family TSCPD domain-containing protein [Bacilli bacterium]|nr:TIGR03905 family TSCPD domain-containing protein [Bacilli bacterium]